MKIDKKLKNQFRIQNGIFVILLLGVAVSLSYLCNKIDLQWDVTSNKRHSLSETSLDFISRIEQPITITAFVSKNDVEGSLRPVIHGFLEPYRRAKPDINIIYIDPRENPKKAEDAGIRFDGELVVEYQGRKENLSTLTEQELTNLFVRLSRASDKTIFVLQGHKERALDGNSPRDISIFGQQLSKTGFKVAGVNLTQELNIDQSASLLIIASPKSDLLPGETNRIKRFLEAGGNLLWLLENNELRGMNVLAEYIGLKLANGITFDPRAGSLNLSPAFSLASRYLEHPATKGSSMTSVFPYAQSIQHQKTSSEFTFTPLVEVADQGWLEVNDFSNPSFDPKVDLPGPIVVAGAFERPMEKKTQRIIAVGTGNSLSNQHIGLLGNLDFGVNAVNWLTGDESLITIQPRSKIDQTLEINLGVFILANFFFCLPVIFVLTGGIIWWRRRQA